MSHLKNKIRLGVAAFTAVMLCPSIRTEARHPSLPPLTPEQQIMKDAIKEWHPVMSRMLADVPAYVDNSQSRFFPPIFSQGIDNSCSQASGVRYVYTYETNRMLGRDAAEQANVFGYHFTWNFLNEGDNEGSHAWIGWDLMKDCGTLNISRFDDRSSYANQTVWPTGFETYTEAMQYRVESYAKFNLKTREGIDLLRRYLFDHGDGSANGGIATISWQTDDWGLQSYDGPSKTGIRHIIKREGTDGPHAITVVGYDDTVEFDFDGDGIIAESERGAFIFANSWDTFWASDGKCYIPYSVLLAPAEAGGLSEGDADAYMVTPLIGEPSIVFEIDLSYTRRNELSFTLGAADGAENKAPSVDFTYPIMNRQGGALPMQGSGKDTQIETAMNFSRYYEKVKDYKEPKFFLSVRRTAATGTGQITSFRVRNLMSGEIYESTSRNTPLTGGLITLTSGAGNLLYYPSCSKWRWLNESTGQPIASPFVIRVATGETRKMQVVRYDKAKGTLTIRHSEI